MLLEARNLAFAYPKHPPLFSDWSASFAAGEATAIVGESGRGKSTLLYLLGLMLKPLEGGVLLNGVEVSGRPDTQLAGLRANLYGFVFQDAALDPSRTVLDNVLETALYRGQDPRHSEQTALKLLKEFKVDGREHRKPGQVSGGQAQRIALCRALLNRPKILLADEPTGNLDPESASIVVDALTSYAVAEEAVVIIVTHSQQVASRCQKTVTL